MSRLHREVTKEALNLPPQAARGGAFADYNNNGGLGVAVSRMDAKPLLLENTGVRNNWLRLKLIGTKCNRQAVGARVRVTAGGITQYESVRAGGSFLSSNDPRLHFGLGSATQAEIEVTWPGGSSETFSTVPVNRQLDIRER